MTKHSNANRAWVRARQAGNLFRIIVEDNGNRDTAAKTKQSRRGYFGNGRGILAERTSLINRLFPASLKIDAGNTQGFRVVLEIEVEPGSDGHNTVPMPNATKSMD